MARKFLIPLVILLILLILSMIAGHNLHSASDGETPSPDPEPGSVAAKGNGGGFYARVHLKDDVRAVNIMYAEVKTLPAMGKDWPGVQFHKRGIVPAQNNTWNVIQIRNISVPQHIPDHSRPHRQVDRERQRFDEAIDYVRAVVLKSETLLLKNPKAIDDVIIECDVFVHLGGFEMNLAEMLVNDGFALYGKPGDHDWGGR